MNSSRVEPALAGITSAFGGERLGELLTAVAEARDFEEAAELLLSQVTEAAGARRSCLLHVRQEGVLALASCIGFDEPPVGEHPVDDLGNPLVVAALSLMPVGCGGRTDAAARGPFAPWLALPYPKPQERGSLALLPEARARELLAGCVIYEPALSDSSRRTGHAPGGVLVLDAPLPEPVISALSRVILLAGPVLSRVAAAEEYRRSAVRLDQQRDLLTGIVNSLPDPIVITDASNDIIVQNSRAEHLFSFSDTDSEGRRRAVEINNLLFTSFLSRTVIGGATTGGARELNLVDPDEGTDLLFEVLAHPLAAAVSKDGAFVSVLRDVTDLRRAAIELERQVQRGRVAEMDATRERDRLNLILENVGDPILVTDDRSNIILMNRLAEELFQLPDDVTADRLRAQAVRGNDTRFTTFISDFTLSPANSRREQMRLVHPQNARELPVEVVSGKILNERGEPLAIVSVLHDLTKQVENERLYQELKKFSSQLEDRIRAATADLAEQNARLQWQSRELEKANRLKSEFLASMSHELRTPINALIGYTALMLDRIYGDLTDRQEEGLRRIQAAAQHLLALINDILDLAKIEAGKMPLHLSEVDLTQLAGELNQQIEPLVRKKALEFDLDVPGDAPVMLTDRVKVKQILLNLLSNAVKFTHHGSVRLRVLPLDGRIRFEVVDSGIGIDAKDLESIWEDFRQLDQSRTREYGGTGLGLSITRKLVARLGGSIEVASEVGRGSTFAVTLPVRTPTPEPSPAAEPAMFGARSA